MEKNAKPIFEVPSDSLPKFIDTRFLQKEQLNDPDYRLRFLEKLYCTKYPISCSKCHHCK